MNIQIDFRSDIPIYVQVVEQIRQQVADGSIQPGEQLPTVRALAAELRINFNTIARAYRLLDEAGVISTQQGRGTYILETAPPDITEKMKSENLDILARRYLSEAHRLGFSKAQALERIEQISKETNRLQDS